MAGPTVSKCLPVPVYFVDGVGEDATVVRDYIGMSGVTTNTTSSAFTAPSGPKTFWAEVSGTGAVAATVDLYGARTNVAANGVLLATITLSGTTKVTDAAAAIFATYPYYYVVTTGVSGTGATVNAEVYV